MIVNTNTSLTKEEVFQKKAFIDDGVHLLQDATEHFMTSQKKPRFEEGWDE
jgi:HD-GYP domain-containing protein (c-di-GMP phosphodiesterase class II)